jgi:hypothetical protein
MWVGSVAVGGSAFAHSVGSSVYSIAQTYFGIGQWIVGDAAGVRATLDCAYNHGPLGQSQQIGPGTHAATSAAIYTATAAASAAGGVAAWGAMGGGQFAIGLSSNATTAIPHITFGYGVGGAYTWAHGISTAQFVTSRGAGPGSIVTVSGVPILTPTAVATWVGTNPYASNCLSPALQAFLVGLGF